MKASPSLITSYFGRKGAKLEEISKQGMNGPAAKEIWEQGRFNPVGKLSRGSETPC
jgi:hypothetical protein